MPLRRLNQQRKLEAEKGPLDEFFTGEPAPGPPKPVISHYVNPLFRLDQEMKKRGIAKRVGYTTADAHYERKVHEVSWIIQYGKKQDWPLTWTQQFWLYDKGGGKWEACWNEIAAMSGCAPPFATADEAVDQLIKWADTPHKVDVPPPPEVYAFDRLEQEMQKHGFTKITKISQKNYYEKPFPIHDHHEAWKARAWIVEPWGQIKTYGAYYSDSPRSSEFVGGGATLDEAVDALLARIDRPQGEKA